MTEPIAVTNFRSMLLESSTVTTAGITSATLFYPKAVVTSDDTTAPAVKPYGVLYESPGGRRAFLEPGVIGIPFGTVACTFHFVGSDIGTAEKFVRDVATDLYKVVDGMPIRDISYALASEPQPGAIAANNTAPTASEVTATLTLEYGLNT